MPIGFRSSGRVAPIAFAALLCSAVGALAQQVVTINDTRVFPESITSTSDGTLIIGSSERGNIYKAAPGSQKAELWIAKEQGGLGSLLGVFADEVRGTLYVCSSPATPAGATEAKAFDLKSGALKATYPFVGGGRCNDFAAAPDGTIYATDTPGGRVMRLKPGATEMEPWDVNTNLIGVDGIAFANGQLYINNVTKNLLQRIEIRANGDHGELSPIELSSPLAGPDGMRSGPNNTLLIAENRAGRLTQASIDAEGKATLKVLKDGFGQLTAVTLVGKTAWVSEAKFALRADTSKDPGPFTVVPVALP